MEGLTMNKEAVDWSSTSAVIPLCRDDEVVMDSGDVAALQTAKVLDGYSLHQSEANLAKYCIKNNQAVYGSMFLDKCRPVLGDKKCVSAANGFASIQIQEKLSDAMTYVKTATVGLIGYGLTMFLLSKGILGEIVDGLKTSWAATKEPGVDKYLKRVSVEDAAKFAEKFAERSPRLSARMEALSPDAKQKFVARLLHNWDYEVSGEVSSLADRNVEKLGGTSQMGVSSDRASILWLYTSLSPYIDRAERMLSEVSREETSGSWVPKRVETFEGQVTELARVMGEMPEFKDMSDARRMVHACRWVNTLNGATDAGRRFLLGEKLKGLTLADIVALPELAKEFIGQRYAAGMAYSSGEAAQDVRINDDRLDVLGQQRSDVAGKRNSRGRVRRGMEEAFGRAGEHSIHK